MDKSLKRPNRMLLADLLSLLRCQIPMKFFRISLPDLIDGKPIGTLLYLWSFSRTMSWKPLLGRNRYDPVPVQDSLRRRHNSMAGMTTVWPCLWSLPSDLDTKHICNAY